MTAPLRSEQMADFNQGKGKKEAVFQAEGTACVEVLRPEEAGGVEGRFYV